MKKEWRPVVGYEGLYEVSNYGEVASLNYSHTGKRKVLKPGKNSNGYLKVILYKDGIKKTFLVHRLVAEAFIPNPDGFPQVDHINGIRNDNRASNLRWASQKENCNFPMALANKSKAQNRPEVKEKLSKAQKETWNQPEIRKKRSKSLKETWNRPEVREKHSKAMKYVWNRPEIREKYSKALTNHKSLSKPVVQLTINGEFVAKYQSLHEANRHTGVSQGNISGCCLGNRKSAGGFIWRYD